MGFLMTFRRAITKFEEKQMAVRSMRTGKKLPDGKDEFAVEYEKLGWFVQLDGFTESLCVALPTEPKPDIEVGQIMCCTWRAEPKATP